MKEAVQRADFLRGGWGGFRVSSLLTSVLGEGDELPGVGGRAREKSRPGRARRPGPLREAGRRVCPPDSSFTGHRNGSCLAAQGSLTPPPHRSKPAAARASGPSR